jgi:hypothetical protein
MFWRRCTTDGTHNFQPRYDEQPPATLRNANGPPDDLVDVIRALTVKTYVCDVCTWCGKQVQRPK